MTLPSGVRGQLVAVAILIIMVLLAYRLAVVPLVDRYQSRQAEITDMRTAIDRYQRLIAQAPALEAFDAQYRRQQPLAPLLLPGGNPALAGAALQQRLQDIAAGVDVRILSQRIRPPATDGEFERIGVEARLQSDVTGLRDLLLAIEQNTPFLFVDSLSIRSRAQRSRRGVTARQDIIDTRLVIAGLRAPGSPAGAVP
jgi:general secretion pathway protein M